MNRRRATTVLTLVCAAALTAGLAACVPEGSRPAPSTSTSGATSGAASGSATSAAPTPSGTATSASPTVDGRACLAGTWTMDQAGLDRFYGDVNALTGGAGASFTPSGSATLALTPEGGFTWTPDTQITAVASGTTIQISLSGDTTGTFSATADRLTTDTQSTDDLVVVATIGGVETDPGPIAEQIAAAPITDAGYTCTTDTLTLQTPIAGGTATSILHR